MRRSIAFPAALLAISCAASPPSPAPRQLPNELAGRIAGKPERCVLIQAGEGLRFSEGDSQTLLYGNGRTVWANDLGPHCTISPNDILINEPLAPYYCRGDLVRSLDHISKIPGPACVLGDFVPYRR
jgi:hypothetical protein